MPHNDEDRISLTSFLAERGVTGDPSQLIEPRKVGRAVLPHLVVVQCDPSSHVGAQGAEAVDDGVVDRLEATKRTPTLATWAHSLAVYLTWRSTRPLAWARYGAASQITKSSWRRPRPPPDAAGWPGRGPHGGGPPSWSSGRRPPPARPEVGEGPPVTVPEAAQVLRGGETAERVARVRQGRVETEHL
jgi:hypothetical protein